MERLEKFAIREALRLCHGNRTKAASLLGISRDTLYRKLRQLKEVEDGVEVPTFRSAKG